MHVVRRHDHLGNHRAQRRRRRVVEAVVVLEHGKVRRAAEGFQLRVGFFEMAANALFAIIHAEHQLRHRAGRMALPASVIGRQAGQDLLAIMALIGLQPEEAALMLIELAQSAQQRFSATTTDAAQRVGGHAQMLRQAIQRPGRARQAMADGALRRRCIAPGFDALGQPGPQARVLRQSGIAGGRQVRLNQVEQVFRKIALMKGMPHPEFGWMVAEVVAERRQAGGDMPVALDDVTDDKAFEQQTHGEIVDHVHRHIGRSCVAGMILAPKEHAGPARQFERQPLQIPGPALLGQTQPRQFRADGIECIGR